MKNAWIDFLICYFLGIFGVHKFREKKIGWGILYILTGGLFGFGWLYDIIKYLVAAIQITFKWSTSSENKTASQINPRISKIIKIALIVFVAVFLLLIFSVSCSMLFTCEHQYTPATCIQPKTCTKCGQTEGEPAEHSWAKAMCIAPKTCSVCNLTEGSPSEHKWVEATCQTPKICDACGKIEGGTTSHNYSNGKCSYCGKATPVSSSSGSSSDNSSSSDSGTSSTHKENSTMVWIPTKGGKKYHSHSGCSNMDNPQHVTISEAQSQGFTACKRCH